MQEVHVADLPPFQQRGKEEEGESVQLMEVDDRQVCFEVGREDGVGLHGHAAILYHIPELAHHPGLALQLPLQKSHVLVHRNRVHVDAQLKNIAPLLELFDHVGLAQRDNQNEEVR